MNKEEILAQMKEQEDQLVEMLMKDGMDEAEARRAAKKEIEGMGTYKTMLGSCPIGALNPIACMYCAFGHMTDCHYPHTCEEAECSHFRAGLADELSAETWHEGAPLHNKSQFD